MSRTSWVARRRSTCSRSNARPEALRVVVGFALEEPIDRSLLRRDRDLALEELGEALGIEHRLDRSGALGVDLVGNRVADFDARLALAECDRTGDALARGGDG